MIVHIVPTLPPDLSGLADYCFKLSQNWPDDSVAWGCLSRKIPSGAAELWPLAQLVHFEASQKGLLEALETLPVDTLILHYVGYAYHPKGIPLWLPVALKQWKAAHPQKQLVIMFHELWAGGPPWRSCFWVMPKAKSIVADLAGASDFWVTSCGYYFDKIVEVGGRKSQGAVIPIATGIEPDAPIDFQRPWPLFNGGQLKIAVFGLASTRNSALSVHTDLLRELCKEGKVECISLLGQSPRHEKQSAQLEALIAKIGGDSVWHRAYDLSPPEVSALLRQHDVGIVKEKQDFLNKSSVFAVLCSHGVLPICSPSKTANKTLDSPFLIDSGVRECSLQLQDKNTIEEKKRKLETVATTSLTWSWVARSWKNHLNSKNN